MKIFIVILIFTSSLFGKYCYKNKYNEVCYFKYFDRKAIYKAKNSETYFLSSKRNIYAFTDKIEVKFKAFGAILSVLDDFEIEFVDKIKEAYIFKVKYKDELFSIVTRLNALDTISKAVPVKTRKYTKKEISFKAEAKKERLRRALEKSNKNKKTNQK
ncbi:MAG: hypothetical protein DRG78_19035 [Epsilonproteobacteria bacterium]|nr:MAG: hypothetical protein DRG78_19035 [Campylobacterota bacterium]